MIEKGIPNMGILGVAQFLACIVLVSSTAALQAQATAAVDTGCSKAQLTTAPHALISNSLVNAVVYLPGAETGYYRATRFDWSGSVACLAYKGHTYWGVWFPKYDPLINDAITGPVEEFRGADRLGIPFYNAQKPGGEFVKVGVGVLRKVDDKPYELHTLYPIVDGGKRTMHISKNAVTFQQDLKSQLGMAYAYTKTLKLDKDAPVLEIEHTLKNTGSTTIDLMVYDHNFLMVDNETTGPHITVSFPFEAKADQPLQYGAHIDGKQLVYDRNLKPGEIVQSNISGSSNTIADYDFHIENSRTGAGVEQTSGSPLAALHLWSIYTTVCPEAYVHVNLAPGQTQHWTIRYRFYTK
jgi:hypothetical protein